MHVADPEMELNLPALQAAQVVEPAALKLPAGQSMHPLEPLELLYEPEGQRLHDKDPTSPL